MSYVKSWKTMVNLVNRIAELLSQSFSFLAAGWVPVGSISSQWGLVAQWSVRLSVLTKSAWPVRMTGFTLQQHHSWWSDKSPQTVRPVKHALGGHKTPAGATENWPSVRRRLTAQLSQRRSSGRPLLHHLGSLCGDLGAPSHFSEFCLKH